MENSLSDDIINELYSDPCVIIGVNILAKHYNSSVCVSYHNLDKHSLGDVYDENNKYNYMIK